MLPPLHSSADGRRRVQVFFISCVNGINLPVLLEYLSKLRPRRDWSARTTGQVGACLVLVCVVSSLRRGSRGAHRWLWMG